MKTKRPYWIQIAHHDRRIGTYYSSIGTPYGNLSNAIKGAKRLKADRIYDTTAKTVVWERGQS